MLAWGSCLGFGVVHADRVLVDFEDGMPPGAEAMYGVEMTLQQHAGSCALRIQSPSSDKWPGVSIPGPDGHWDFSMYQALAADVKNVGANPVRVGLRFDAPDDAGTLRWRQSMVELAPGQQQTIETPIRATMLDVDGSPIDLPGMKAGPWGPLPQAETGVTIDPGAVTRILVFAGRPHAEFAFEIDNIRLSGSTTWHTPDRTSFFPFVDPFGQYRHAEWSGKVHSTEDITNSRKRELADLSAYPRPRGLNKYGGWQDGPTLEATGFFRTEKVKGKWWLVDPEGRLFWSAGPNAVRIAEEFTPVTDRGKWFAWMPRDDPVFAAFFGQCTAWQGRLRGQRMEGFSFGRANMFRRYGSDWQDAAADMAHRRLHSWGLNTLANWSDESVRLMRRTPYVVAVHCRLNAWLGDRADVQDRFPDVFDASFETAVRKRMHQEVGKSAGDPWCIGYFVDNELKWGRDTIQRGALTAAAGSPAKRAFVQLLRNRYENVAGLNRAWETEHASWEALLASRTPPDATRAAADYAAFLTLTAERYFHTVRKAVKETAPDNLYLGCRFNTFSPEPAQVAAQVCDVVSYNYYREPDQVATFEFPGEADVPLLIGEWHFGALDRGDFWEGIRRAGDQAERARKYALYMRNALAHPQLVGAHWFRYRTQPLTGRPSNGENGQIGLVDICDLPYPETIAAVRKVARNMYPFRLHGTWRE